MNLEFLALRLERVHLQILDVNHKQSERMAREMQEQEYSPEAHERAAPADASAPRRAKKRGVEASTQADGEQPDWTSYDLGRARRVLQSRDERTVKMAFRRLHIRFWHASAARMRQLLKAAGVPEFALNLIKDVVDTCRICRCWTKPTPKSLAPTRLSTELNHAVQWDILFYKDQSHCG